MSNKLNRCKLQSLTRAAGISNVQSRLVDASFQVIEVDSKASPASAASYRGVYIGPDACSVFKLSIRISFRCNQY